MKKMFFYEWKKVVGQTFFWKFLAIVFLLNLFVISSTFLYSQHKQGYYQEQFMSEMDASELKHREEVLDYYVQLNKRIEESEKLRDSTLFQVIQGIDEQYVSKKIDKLYALSRIKMDYRDVRGADVLFQSDVTYLLFLIVCLLCGYLVFTSEEEQGTMFYLHTMKQDGSVFVQKFACALLLSLGCGILLFFSNYILGCSFYGAYEWNTSILQLKGMLESVHHITLYEYLFFFIVSLVLFLTLIQCMVAWLSFQFKNATVVFGGLITLFLIEGLLYYFIADDSYLVVFKELNLVMFLFQLPMFQSYRSVSFLMHCDLYLVMYMLVFMGTVVFFISACFAYRHGKSIKLFRRIKFKHTTVYSLAFYEAYKLFWKQGALILLVLFGCVRLNMLNEFHVFIDRDTYYYQLFSKELEGEPSIEKQVFIQHKNDEYISIHEQILMWNEMYKKGEISEVRFNLETEYLMKALYSEEGFRRSEAQYRWVEDNEVLYVEESGYQYLLSEGKMQLGLWFCLSLAVIACMLSNVISYDESIAILLDTAIYRRKYINRWKYFYACFIALVCYSLGIVFYLENVLKCFQMNFMQAPISSLMFLDCDSSISILNIFMIFILLGCLISIVYACLCVKISEITKSSSKALMILFSILLVFSVVMFLVL